MCLSAQYEAYSCKQSPGSCQSVPKPQGRIAIWVCITGCLRPLPSHVLSFPVGHIDKQTAGWISHVFPGIAESFLLDLWGEWQRSINTFLTSCCAHQCRCDGLKIDLTNLRKFVRHKKLNGICLPGPFLICEKKIQVEGRISWSCTSYVHHIWFFDRRPMMVSKDDG